MILIDSTYINKSGGKILLEYFIEKLLEIDDINKYLFLIDHRLESNLLSSIPKNNQIITKGSESQRKKAFQLALDKNIIKCFFSFNNLPPPIKIKNAPVFIYFHNVLLLNTRNTEYKLAQKLSFQLKTFYILIKNNKTYNWIVQTEEVRNDVISKFKLKQEHVLTFPFFRPLKAVTNGSKRNGFIYAADGVRQKNHILLFQIWEYLADKHQLFPELNLTLDVESYPEHIKEIERLKQKGIQIRNWGVIKYESLLELYGQCDYLIFPSLKESFGLPLIEATAMGCKIIAADLPYVHAVIKPSITFNPFYKDDLANIIWRLLNKSLILPESNIMVRDQVLKIIEVINQNTNV